MKEFLSLLRKNLEMIFLEVITLEMEPHRIHPDLLENSDLENPVCEWILRIRCLHFSQGGLENITSAKPQDEREDYSKECQWYQVNNPLFLDYTVTLSDMEYNSFNGNLGEYWVDSILKNMIICIRTQELDNKK